MILESPKDGHQYVFELNDRLISDKELDGLTEIPVKPDTDGQQLKPAYDAADGEADQLEVEESVSSRLQGQSSIFYFIYFHAVFTCDVVCFVLIINTAAK